ncbi:MFS transporter [Candidatus Poribacteria bacterium]|nr:MFS transporter [Candidatus Poribacteria bacterium]
MKSWNRNFRLLACAVFGVGAFFGILFPLFNNFIVERIGIEAHELGYMEALREIPGFLNALFIALMMRFAPPIVGGISLIVMGLGMAAYSQASSLSAIIIFSLVWSLGFHAWIPLQGAMALAYSEGKEKGKPLGQLRSVASLATLGTIVLCMFAVDVLEFEGLFQVGGVLAAIGGIAIMFASPRLQTQREDRFVLRKRYRLYYLLSFLQGWRKQIFITFAIFALVKLYSTDRSMIIKLILINQVVVFIFSPLMGWLVDKLGERIMLSASYLGLFFVFIGYAVLKNVNQLYVLYCIDNFLFVGGIALTTYLSKIAPPKDIKPTLAMGVTMNHIASVTSPLVGGLIWMKFDYRLVFLGGAVFALISLIVTQWIKAQPVVMDAELEMATD